jgi:PAS domain-containing protein
VLGISIDITERKQAREALTASLNQLAEREQFIRTVTDNLPGMVAYWDTGCAAASPTITCSTGWDAARPKCWVAP